MKIAPIFLCNINDLTATHARSVELEIEDRIIDIMVVQQADNIYTYHDRCPHAGTPLEWREHDFLTEDKQHIMCATHGARFQIHDGLCVSGPCKQRSLSALESEVREDSVYLLELPTNN